MRNGGDFGQVNWKSRVPLIGEDSRIASHLTTQSPWLDKAHRLRSKLSRVMSSLEFVCALVARSTLVQGYSLRLSMTGLVHSLQSVAEVCSVLYCGTLRVLNSLPGRCRFHLQIP